jgi:hypothetical protein
MATTYKILAQIASSGSAATLYTVPASTQAVVSSLIVCNQSSVATTYSIAVCPSGDTVSSENYIARNISISGSDSTALTLGITLGAGDFISVTGMPTGSFSAFGSQIS